MKNKDDLILSKIYKDDEESLLFNQLSNFYATHFKYALQTFGSGIIIDGGGNLSPIIVSNTSSSKNITINFEVGSFLDRKGRLVVVSNKLNQSFNIDEFYQKTLFFYITSVEVLGEKIEHQGGFILQDTVFTAKINFYTEKQSLSDNYIEVCRIFISGDKISHPCNPFNPQDNELDIRFVPRILSNHSLSHEVRFFISSALHEYACFFMNLAMKINSNTISLVASDAFTVASSLKLNVVSTFEVYELLAQLIKITTLFYSEVQDKIEDIEKSDFRRSLSRLESIFFSEESLNDGSVKFYDLSLENKHEKKNFWENIFAHIRDISESKDLWKIIVNKEEVFQVQKKYLLLGRVGGDGLDIEIDYEYVSSNHLKITKNDINSELLDIEDLGSANGTYFEGIRYEKHKKVTVHKNSKIELYDYEFDIYNNPIVVKFLDNLN